VTSGLSTIAAKISRFSLVGAANGLIYAAATAGFISLAGLPPALASAAGYMCVLPFTYLAHKRFTFRSDDPHSTSLWRFIVTFVAGLLTCLALMELVVSYLRLPYLFGIAAGILCVPIITLLVLDKWVFRMQADRGVR
jgi:putative flippase GtrA